MYCENLIGKEFKNPSNEFRPVPFWSWNDKLEENELIRQIKGMKSKGIGGFFMHSRIGLLTPYLSHEWMEKIKICVNEAKKIGLNAWLYDEDRWPSGFAGGLVPAKGPKYRMKAVELKEFKDLESLKKIGKMNPLLKVFLCYKENEKPKNLEDITDDIREGICDFPPSRLKDKIVLCFSKIHAPNTPWHNGYPYIDTLYPKAVDAFIESTHKTYYSEVGSDFGGTIPGIFTDEPSYFDFHGYSDEGVLIPWTEKFTEYFQNKRGYNILEYLPSLFYEVGDFHKIRYDYWSAATELFVETFSSRIYNWCDNHNLKLTGHYLGEDTLQSQVAAIGSAMPHYEYMHIPGIDHLGRNIQDLITVKQVSSVAHQLGKERVLCESYACSGWDLSFEDQKWIGDWLYALGVNLLNQSMFSYSLRGCRKRDFPPLISYQQPSWKHYKIVADYFNRLSYVLTKGEFVSDIMVLHPIGSAWCVYNPVVYSIRLRSFFGGSLGSSFLQGLDEIDRLNENFVWLSRALCEMHRDYDFGDEVLMRKYARVEDGKLTIGKHSYSVVIIPSMISISKNSFDLFKRFTGTGGKVIAIVPPPYLTEGETSDELQSFFESKEVMVIEKEELRGTLDKILFPDVMVIDEDEKDIGSVYYQHRKVNNNDLYFFANTNRKKGFNALVRVKENGRLEEWNPKNGKLYPIDGRSKDGYTSFGLYFNPVQSHLIVLKSTDRPDLAYEEHESKANNHEGYLHIVGTGFVPVLTEVSKLSREWNFERLDSNALTLDYCSYRIGNGEFTEIVPVWKAQSAIRSYYGLDDHRGNDGIQFWKLYQDSRSPDFSKKETNIYLRYNFDVEFDLNRERKLSLVLETPEKFELEVNGKKIKYKDCGWWIDPSFKKLDISNLIRAGKNEVILKCDLTHWDKEPLELESCYIIGDFGVKNEGNQKFYLVDEKKKLTREDLIKQGYPFYAGTIAYIQEFEIKRSKEEQIYLELDSVKATVVKVLINDKEAGLLCWHPYRLDISKFIKNGTNWIRIELTNSLRNLLGPHHKKGELFWVGPGHFSDEQNWIAKYNFVEFGLLGDVRLLRYR
ncbi:MAG: glycosyl hydrolase [candidate division WOR-3 bacterium]|nr:glycosyl hydrolase [candidate division WOR-3 bacterium]